MTYSMDAVFVKEFDTMVRELAVTNRVDLFSLPVPDSFHFSKMDISFDQVTFRGIEEQYYGGLNETTGYLLSRPNLVRKKFNSNGDYVKDKNGNYFTEDVTVPQECVAVLSRKRLGVPLRFKSQLGFEYVDLYVNNESKELFYIYIVPRQFVYKLNLCALCLSLEKPRKLYGGCQVYLCSGHKVFLYIAPYKISSVVRNYRVFSVKPSLDFTSMYKDLLTFWGENGIIFNIEWLWLTDVIGDRNNAGYSLLENTLDEYLCYDDNVSLADNRTVVEELDDIVGV